MIDAHPQRLMIPVDESFAEWRKDPKYIAAYTALENEFARAVGAAMRLRISFEAYRRGEGWN